MKEFLSQRGVPYVEKNVLTDAEALRELEATGYLSTPVTVIDAEVVVGFNRQRLEELLAE